MQSQPTCASIVLHQRAPLPQKSKLFPGIHNKQSGLTAGQLSSKGAAVRSGKSCFKTGVSSASRHSDLGTASWCVLCRFYSGWIPQIPKYRVKGNLGRQVRAMQPPKINYAQWNRISARVLDTMEQDRKMKTSYSQDSSLICLFIWTWGKITQHFHMLQL